MSHSKRTLFDSPDELAGLTAALAPAPLAPAAEPPALPDGYTIADDGPPWLLCLPNGGVAAFVRRADAVSEARRVSRPPAIMRPASMPVMLRLERAKDAEASMGEGYQ